MGQLHLPVDTAQLVRHVLKTALDSHILRCRDVFRLAPYAAIWVVLDALARRYGETSRDVYLHIAAEMGLDFEAQLDRQTFKSAYLIACRAIGLRVIDHSNPTGLFFGNLGIADAQASRLATTMLSGAHRVGAPPEEDLVELRAWQSKVTDHGLDTYTRIKVALQNDTTSSYAQLFCNWRAGEPAQNSSAASFFQGLDDAQQRLNIDAKALSTPPMLIWTRHGFSLLASESSRTQLVHHDGYPTRLIPGRPWSIPAPWPAAIEWRSGTRSETIKVTPTETEVLVFAMDTQRLVGDRQKSGHLRLAVPTRDILVVAGSPFHLYNSDGATDSINQGQIHVALASVGQAGVAIDTTQGRIDLHLETEPVIRMRGPVIGRNGSRPLHASDCCIALVSGKGFAETRTVRMRHAGKISHIDNVCFDDEGRAEVRLADFGLDRPDDPCEIEVALLVAGAGPGHATRVEITSRFFVWPGTSGLDPSQLFRVGRTPANFHPATSEHILYDASGLWMDGSTGFTHATLSLNIDGRHRDFSIPVRGTRLIRNAIADNTREPVALGSILLISHAQRQDTLSVHCTDPDVDLDLRGTIVRRPFIARSEWEIPASQIHPDAPDGDEIALVRRDGSRELLVRIARSYAPYDVDLHIDDDEVVLRIELASACDAIGLDVHRERSADEPDRMLVNLGSGPIDRPTPAWLQANIVRIDPFTVEIHVNRRQWRGEPGVGIVIMRSPGASITQMIEDDRGRPYAIPLAAPAEPPPIGRDPQAVRGLARILAGTYEDRCDVEIRKALQPRAATFVARIAATGFVSPLLPLVFSRPLIPGRATLPRFDVLDPDLAPEIFGGDPFAFNCFEQIPAARRLALMATVPSMPVPLLFVDDTEVEITIGRWLAQLHDPQGDCPAAISAEALKQAFLSFRQNACGSDFAFVMAHETVGATLRKVLDVYTSIGEPLLDFDEASGSDRTGVALAAYLARYARACRSRGSRTFHDAVARRTSLPVSQVTPATSLALHVGCDLFAYFLVFWTLHDRAQGRS